MVASLLVSIYLYGIVISGISTSTINSTVVPIHVATLVRGHPYYEATISGSKLCIIVFNIPLTRYTPHDLIRPDVPKVALYLKRGTTVLLNARYLHAFHTSMSFT